MKMNNFTPKNSQEKQKYEMKLFPFRKKQKEVKIKIIKLRYKLFSLFYSIYKGKTFIPSFDFHIFLYNKSRQHILRSKHFDVQRKTFHNAKLM